MILTSVDKIKFDEGDCACAYSTVAQSPGATHPHLWQQASGLLRQSLGAGHELVVVSPQLKGVSVINELAGYMLDAFSFYHLPDEFSLSHFHGLQENDVFPDVKQLVALNLSTSLPAIRAEAQSSEPNSLTSWFHLTDRCNLRCSYCYLPHVREDMSSEIGYAAIDAIFRSALVNGFKQVKLKYAGGEPLLRYPLILELHDYAKSLADSNGLILEEVVLSNGTLLTGEMAQTFKTLGIRLMISLDGYGDYHDSHRLYASGRGSFKDVAEAVGLALANGLIPNISVTVSSRTAEGLPQIMAWILKRDLPFSLNFYRKNEFSASREDMELDDEKIINGMLMAFRVIEENLPKRSFLGGIMDRANLSSPHTHTCGVGQNYLVFDQNGQVAKCQMQIRKPITDVHLEDPLAVIRADEVGIQNISVEEKDGCKTCEWKYWCTGGCPLETHRVTGCYDVKSPNCNIYKVLFPEALRLEGLRLLKYADDPEVVMKI